MTADTPPIPHDSRNSNPTATGAGLTTLDPGTGMLRRQNMPGHNKLAGAADIPVCLRNGKAIAPTGKTFDVEFGQTTKWDGDRLIIISAFWDAAVQAKQIGLAGWLACRSGRRQ